MNSSDASNGPKQLRAYGSKHRYRHSAMNLMIVVLASAILMGCNPSRQDEKLPTSSDPFQIGETVYVCGCPMMCCNSISRNPDGRCICNMPLRKGTVSKIQDHILVVSVFGREKIIFLKNQ